VEQRDGVQMVDDVVVLVENVLSEPRSAVTIEVLYFDGCPNHEALLPHLEHLVCAASVSAEIRLREIPNDDTAQRERFLGSPSVRVDGQDIEPGAEARDDFGLKCRLYPSPSGLAGVPRDEWLLQALERAARRAASPLTRRPRTWRSPGGV
jgi:hypothetical protein